MQKAKQKADNNKAATAPKKRVLPARSTHGKAPLKEVDFTNAEDLPQKKDKPAPKEDLSQKNGEPAPKKKIRPIKAASLQPQPPQLQLPHQKNSETAPKKKIQPIKTV
ncbi:hypothetical protein PGTUg99_022713 [Puccinia graminis f. sp. tritici]|uniref:Uncharacterized protein n=1 Tax=Puccinia graminis f. sp. tritici TaxID=56615 RepID=A0A5B0RFS5_PUCGR|nr:hypothetical protein PGTUg99_022713 [Puccinia graminis f. sp. tritici]